MAIKASSSITLSAVRDLQSCTRYYLLQSSTSAAPAKPTANPPGGNWATAEPAYTSGSTNSLYTVDLNVFSDGSWAYSDVSLSSSYEAAKAAWNKAQTAQDAAAQALSNTEVIVGTQTAATGAWTGVASFSELHDGQQIVYWLPYAGSGNATLNLTLSGGNTTGAINCYYGGTTRITTHYGAGSAIHLTYRVNANINGSSYTGWWADANYTDGNTYDRIRLNNSVKAKSAITAGYLIVGDSAGYFHLAGGAAFDVNKPILYAGSAIAAAATGTNNYLAYPTINLRTTLGNSSWTETNQKTIYLAGTLAGAAFTPLSSNYLTTSPAAADVVYISLGLMISTYQMYLYPEHPMYRIIDGVLTSISQIAYEAKATADDAATDIDTLNDDLSAVQALADEAMNAVRDLSVGCVNLVDDSAEMTLEGGGSANACRVLATGLLPDTAYTLSMASAVKTAGTAAGMTLEAARVSGSTETILFTKLLDFSAGHTKHTFTTDSGGSGHCELRLYAGVKGATNGVTVKLTKVKLEEGTVATMWSESHADAEARLAGLVSQLNATRDGLEDIVTHVTRDLDGTVRNVNAYFRFDGSDANNPKLIVGSSESPMTMELTNSRLSFLWNGDPVAYFSDNKLYVTNVEAVERLSVGTTANGYLDIVTTATGVGFLWRS
jgi:hypothetical protein